MSDNQIVIAEKNYVIIDLPGRSQALLDRTVAEIYEVETKHINQAVIRNPEKFPADFCFDLTIEEIRTLNEVTNCDLDWNGGHLPKAFTWEGCNMLATILRSDVATARAIQIIRGFTHVEKYHKEKTMNPTLNFMSTEIAGAKRIAEIFGLQGNFALLAANKAVEKYHGIDCVELLQLELHNAKQQRLYTSTEIGTKTTPPRTANVTNKLLESLGYVVSERKGKDLKWTLTAKGKEYGVYLDTGKKHSDGTPVQQIKWYESIIPIVQETINTVLSQ